MAKTVITEPGERKSIGGDFVIPLALIASVLQLPFLYFWGVIDHPLFLIIPTSAPGVLMQGAFRPLAVGEWIYAIAYTAALTVVLAVWAHRAFHAHIVMRSW